ncbi:unnamed protein product [Lymnaea stagnalis]|uniref:Fucosyltransferase n=1 Tax=Lymnaea stagnalis TaxID=6523 RepID=A0AAV2H709_LYMST
MRWLTRKRSVLIGGFLLVHLIVLAFNNRFQIVRYMKDRSSALVEASKRFRGEARADVAKSAETTSPRNNAGRPDNNVSVQNSLRGDTDARRGTPEKGDHPSDNTFPTPSDHSVSLMETTTPGTSVSGGTSQQVSTPSSGNKTAGAIGSLSSPVETCFRSPYFLCDQDQPKTAPNRTFKIGYYGRPHWQRISVFNFSRCRFSNCVYQGDKVTPDTDVVLVYAVGLRDHFKPPKLLPHQMYAITDWEPPDRVSATFLNNASSVWNHVFNLTITYRVDSDIPVPYSRLKPNPKSNEERPNYYEIAKQKNRTALWFVTRCNVPSRRADYVKEMQKYIDVDIYGQCGKRCSGGEYCTEDFLQYKFYLSFENSFCTDYITEKLFRNFAPGRHIIPVVRGGGSYDKYFPKGLFINAAHFKTPKALALHLKELASDPMQYSKQLAFKDSYVLGEDTLLHEAGCEICTYFNTQVAQPKKYDMKKWLYDGHCKKASEISWPAE